MGWYDSFKGNVAGVNLNGVGDDTGLAAKAFGDAFMNIGKNMNDREAQKKKDEIADKTLESTLKTNDANIASMNARSALYGTQNEAAQKTMESAEEAKATKKLDDAFSGAYRSLEGAENLKLFKDNYRTGNGYGTLSDDAVKQADTYFQSKFNDEAKNVAVSKGYKDFATFAKENEQLVKMADGATMAQLDKYFSDKDMSEAKLAAQENKTANQIALLNKEQEISNLTAAKNKAEIKAEQEKNDGGKNFNKSLLDLQSSIAKEYGKYDEATGQYTIDEDKKEVAKFALDYGTDLLLTGDKNLASIRKKTQDAYTQKQKETEQEAQKSKKSWKDYE